MQEKASRGRWGQRISGALIPSWNIVIEWLANRSPPAGRKRFSLCRPGVFMGGKSAPKALFNGVTIAIVKTSKYVK